MDTVMQRDNERGRVVVQGRRTDDGSRCSLVAVQDHGGGWALYPHGADQLGVRVAGPEAATVANAILTGGS